MGDPSSENAEPGNEYAKEQAAVVHKYSKQARLPGFRKGKVPPGVVRSRFSSEIHSEVMESLVPQYFRQTVVQAGFRPVSQPFIYALEAEPGQAIRFKAVFEVLPEFELGKYQDIKVEKPDIKVADEEVEAELKRSKLWKEEWSARSANALPMKSGDRGCRRSSRCRRG